MAATTQLIHDLLAAVVEKSRTAREEQERVEKELAEASAREAAERAAILDAALQKETKARREAAMAISATSLKQIRAAVMRPTRPLWPVWSMRSTPNRLPQEAAERPLGQKLWRTWVRPRARPGAPYCDCDRCHERSVGSTDLLVE
jgi:hypothetical protein